MQKGNESFYHDHTESCKVALATYSAKQAALALGAQQKAAAEKAAKRREQAAKRSAKRSASREKRENAKKRRRSD